MPKIVNKRFRSLARKAADPLNIVDNEHQQVFSPSEHIHLNGLTETDLFHTIKERLMSRMPSEKCVGTDMVSTFVTDKRFANFKPEQIDELFKILGALLLDRAENVRYGSVDALCYLSTLSDDICDRIVDNNVIRSLLLMLETYFMPINFHQPKVTDRKLTLNLYTDTFNLLSYCAESSSKCIKGLVANGNLQNILCKALTAGNVICEEPVKIDNGNEITDNGDKIADKGDKKKAFDFTSIAISAAECLTVLAEDSPLFQRILINETNDEENVLAGTLQTLINVPTSSETLETGNSSLIYLQTLAIFVGSTVIREVTNVPPAMIQNLLERLQNVMNLLVTFDLAPRLKTLLDKIQSEGKSSTFGQLQEMQALKSFAINVFKSKRAIFELLTNILSLGDNDDSSDTEMMIDDVNEDDDDEAMDGICDPSIHCDNTVLEFFKQNHITSILQQELDKFLSIPPETTELLQTQIYGKELLQCIESWTVSVLSLFSNLIQLKLVESMDSISNSVSRILFQNPESSANFSVEIIEESSNVLREILQSDSCPETLTVEQLQCLEQSLAKSHRLQLNFIKICSIVASRLITKHTTSGSVEINGNHASPPEVIVNQIEVITSVLMKLYGQFAGDLVLKAEVLDSLIDIYSDDNELAAKSMRNVNLLQFLRTNEKLFKSEVKCCRELSRSNAVIGTVAMNLRRFINYKHKSVSN